MKLSARVQPLQKQELYLDHPNSPVHMNFLANLSFVKCTYFDRRKRNPAIHPNHRECMVFLVLFVSVFISFFYSSDILLYISINGWQVYLSCFLFQSTDLRQQAPRDFLFTSARKNAAFPRSNYFQFVCVLSKQNPGVFRMILEGFLRLLLWVFQIVTVFPKIIHFCSRRSSH